MYKYMGCNLKTMNLLDCVLIGVFAVIRLKTVKESKLDRNTHTVLGQANLPEYLEKDSSW